MSIEDYRRYDYLVHMDRSNEINLKRIVNGDPENKCFRLLDFTDSPKDVADPWYTGDFEQTYEDLVNGCNALLSLIMEKKNG